MSKAIFNKIVAKLEKLEEYLKYLTAIQKVNRHSFLTEFYYYGAAERYFQVAIEAMIDIGKLLIIEKKLPKPDDNQEIFDILYQHQIISLQLNNRLRGIVGFRNLLVHEYQKVNREIVYEKLQKNLNDFKNFHQAVNRYLSNT